MTTRREHQNRMVRRFILEAAARVVGRKGAARITMEEIALEAEYSSGALYTYFRNRDDLLEALARYLFEEFRTQVLRPIPEALGFREALALFHQEMQHFGTNRTALLKALFVDVPALFPLVLSKESHDHLQPLPLLLQQHLRGLLQKGVHEGILRGDVSLDAASWLLFGIYDSSMVRMVLEDQVPPEQEFIDTLEIFFNGLNTRD